MECQPAEGTTTIEIRVNGDTRRVPEGSTLIDLLGLLELDPGRVAIEVDRKIARKTGWPERVLTPGAEIEIVQFVGGG